MGAFGSVPGLTVFTMASVLVLGATYLGAAAFMSFSGGAQRAWKVVIAPVALMFVMTATLALLSAIAENQFLTRITGN